MGIQFGFMGVDIFFVISGFVMAYSTHQIAVQRRLHDRFKDSGDFLSKRLVRIVPLYWLALVYSSRRPLLQGKGVAGLGQDFFFIPHVNSVYPDELWPTVSQGWTLNYEMFFYCLFAISLLIWTLRTYSVIPVLIALSLLGYLQAQHLFLFPDIHSLSGALLRFTTRDITLEFCAGIVAHGVWMRGTTFDRWPAKACWAVLLIAVVILVSIASNIGEENIHRGLFLAVPAAVLVLGAVRVSATTRLPWLRLLGDASYAIYLFHEASFGAMKPIAPWLANESLGALKVPVIACCYLLCAVTSGILIHKLIEKPMLNAIRSLGVPRVPRMA